MAKRILYNVGMIIIGGDKKNLFIGDADGQSFTAFRKGSEIVYVPYDFLMTSLATQSAILDNRVDVSKLDNAQAPAYTEAQTTGTPPVATGYRKVPVTNLNDNLTEAYLGAPYFSLKGDTVSDYDNSAADVIYTPASLAMMAGVPQGVAPSITGIGVVDDLINLIQNNILIVIIICAAVYFLDPFGWFGGKKKGKKGKK
ncbi:hypothetical protein [Fibrella aquatilis]|uniref:Uncharacterized protein n=1 Tax=Fibrella aquatilis TaxID=2817059 RepID=A0A939GDB1_9BACT|nr:hypothetical protein [Fibrella aquatilis]MBO0934596.1 hypothetical protein [Fibrella aquatilis]